MRQREKGRMIDGRGGAVTEERVRRKVRVYQVHGMVSSGGSVGCSEQVGQTDGQYILALHKAYPDTLAHNGGHEAVVPLKGLGIDFTVQFTHSDTLLSESNRCR